MNMMTMEHCHLHYLACNNCTFVIWGFHKTRVVMTINYVNFNELLCADLDFAITFCCKQQYTTVKNLFLETLGFHSEALFWTRCKRHHINKISKDTLRKIKRT